MPILLYVSTAMAVLCLVHGFVVRITRPAALVLVVLPLAVVGYALVTGGVYGPADHVYQFPPHAGLAAQYGAAPPKNVSVTDVWSEFFPWRAALRESYARGEWPLWNAYNLAGHPLASEAQSAPYSPFTLIALLLPPAVSMTYTAAIALFLAGVCAFLFARELGLGEGAACVAAAGWALSSCVVISSHTALGFATLYAPLILAAVRRIVWTPGMRAGALLTIALALSTLAGHPESLLLNVLVGCAYALFELIRRRERAWRAILVAIGSGVMALLLCAIFLLPLVDTLVQSHEYLIKSEALTKESYGVPLPRAAALFATHFFPFLQNRSWLSPPFGYIGGEIGAMGSIIVALAAFALWRVRSGETWFFAGLALFGLAAGARWTPLADTLHALPLLSITLHERLAYHGGLALVMLAAIGVDWMLRRDDARAAAIACVVVLIVLAAGTWLLQANVRLAITPSDHGRYRIPAELLFLAAAALLLWRRPRAIVPALLALLVAQRALSEIDTHATVPARAAYPPVPLLEPLAKIRGPFRVVGVGDAFPPHTNTFYGLEDPRGYEAMTLVQYVATWPLWCRPNGIWFHRVHDLTAPFLSFLNVRYAIQSGALPPPRGWRAIGAQPGAVLLENDAWIERVFIPRRIVRTRASVDELVDRMAQVRDFRDVAWITSRDTPGESENGPGTIALRTYSRGGIYEFDASMQRDGYVVISDSAWRGWQAFVDGKRISIDRANAAFLGIHVPAGQHRVRVVFRPVWFVRGRAISAAALTAVLLTALLTRVRSRDARRARRRS